MRFDAQTLCHVGIGLALAALLLACGRKADPSAGTPKTPAVATTLPAAASPVASANAVSGTSDPHKQAAKEENAAYLQRRRREPPVIGGCEERCETPDRAVGHLFDALTTRDLEALRRSFDWSILRVDGKAHGDRWAGMWARVQEHEARKADIERWLTGWLGDWLAG